MIIMSAADVYLKNNIGSSVLKYKTNYNFAIAFETIITFATLDNNNESLGPITKKKDQP